MGQRRECGGGIIYWPGKHNPDQSSNLILMCRGEGWVYNRRGGGLEGDLPCGIKSSISKVRKAASHRVSSCRPK